jgi:RNA polymerase sigma factor (sigma-70 family)
MDIENILKKPGKEWSDEEIEAVFNWLDHSGKMDVFVKFAYGLMSAYGVKNFDLATEVVWDKLTYAFSRIHLYDPPRYRGRKCPFLNWLYYIIARAAVRRAKREARRQARLNQVRQRKQQVPPPPPQAEPEFVWEEMLPYVDKLPPKYKEAIELFYMQNMSCAKAAQNSRWPCSVGAMKVRLFRARQELRHLMKDWEEVKPYLDRLPLSHRQAIILIVQRGLTPAEAARIARCSVDEMGDRMSHARQELDRLKKGGILL